MACKEGLALSKSAYDEVETCIKQDTPMDLQALKSTLRTLNKHFQSLQREQAATHARHTSELDALRSEVHHELVDREANAARVCDRQRFLFERSASLPGQSNAGDRAAASAAFVEAALIALCPHNTTQLSGSDQLAAMHERDLS